MGLQCRCLGYGISRHTWTGCGARGIVLICSCGGALQIRYAHSQIPQIRIFGAGHDLVEFVTRGDFVEIPELKILVAGNFGGWEFWCLKILVAENFGG